MPPDTQTPKESETTDTPQAPAPAPAEPTGTEPSAEPQKGSETEKDKPQPEPPAAPEPQAKAPGKKLSLPHLATRIFGVPLAVSAQRLQTMLAVAMPRFLGGEIVQMETQPREITPDKEGIRIIPIVGTLVKRATPGASMSDLSYGEIEADFIKALNDNSIQTIVLDIHSPGGEVQGCFDLADTIFKARGGKPILAVVNEEACSAAYALASAADKVIVPRTGVVGSVGVIAVHVDESGLDEQMGLKFTTVTAGEHKADFSPHEPLSQDAKAILQAEVDRIYDIFVETVSRNRGLKAEAVRQTEAKFYTGEEGVKVGLADEVGTMGSTLAGILADRVKRQRTLQAKENTEALIQAAQASNVEIIKLCTEVGFPAAAAGFIEKNLTAKAVKDELVRMRADKQDKEEQIQSHVMPGRTGHRAPITIDKADDIYRRRAAAARPSGTA